MGDDIFKSPTEMQSRNPRNFSLSLEPTAEVDTLEENTERTDAAAMGE